MGIIKGILKYFLSIIFISSLFSGIMLYSFHKGFEKDFVISEMKSMLLANEQTASSFSEIQYNANQYFKMNNNTEIAVPLNQRMITITRQDANLSAADFRDFMAGQVLEGSYEMNLTALGFSQNISLQGANDALLYYSKICFGLAILSVLVMIFLLSGRFVLIGIDTVFVAALFYPIKYIIDKVNSSIIQNVPSSQGPNMQGFVGAVFNHVFDVAKSLFLYTLIAGIALIALGILLKFLGVGMWFQSFFEKKEKKK